MNVSNLLAFFYCGPFILILTTWYFSFELTYDDLITYSTYGLLAMWVVTVKHFHQIMNDSKLEILTLPVKLGFDGSKNLLFWFPVFIFSLTLMKFINNDFESIFMLLIIFVTLIFTSIQVLKIDSTASSTFNRYPKIVLISYFIVAFLLMGVDFIWW
jgi:1,4-dihydroxy-2-naphthoate octaprenyltransferase